MIKKMRKTIPATRYVLLLSLVGVTACDVQTTVVTPKDHYDIAIPRDIKTLAGKYKTDFVENRFEDEEVDESLSEAEQKEQLGIRFEHAINALYVGNIRNEHDLHKVLDLVEYSTQLFQENEFSDQLTARSPALANFMIDYQINTALSEPKNSMLDDQVAEQGEILAEQQSAYMNLKYKYERLKRNEEKLRLQLAEMQIEDEEVSEIIAE